MPGLEAQEGARVEQELKVYREGLDEKAVEALVKSTEALKAYQDSFG